MALVMMGSVLVILGNLLADILVFKGFYIFAFGRHLGNSERPVERQAGVHLAAREVTWRTALHQHGQDLGLKVGRTVGRRRSEGERHGRGFRRECCGEFGRRFQRTPLEREQEDEQDGPENHDAGFYSLALPGRADASASGHRSCRGLLVSISAVWVANSERVSVRTQNVVQGAG
jgi:hypothetical protein